MSVTFDGLWAVDPNRQQEPESIMYDRENNRNGDVNRMSSYYQPGMHTNPAYQGTAEKPRHDQVVVPMTGNGAHPGVSVVHEPAKWSWCSTGWACFTSCFCPASTWCGFLALLCSMLSYTDHKSGDYDRSKYKKRWSWCCTITGLLFSILLVVALVVTFVVFGRQVADQTCRGYRAVSAADPWVYFCRSHGYDT